MKSSVAMAPNLLVLATVLSAQAAFAQQGPIRLEPASPQVTTANNAPGSVANVTANAAIAAPSAVQSGPSRVTTDTLDYCKELLGRLGTLMRDSKASALEEARTLSREGERLCQHGQAKGGILRLRQAYVLIAPGRDSK